MIWKYWTCCGEWPVLKSHPSIKYRGRVCVWYECEKCDLAGGLAVTEENAAGLWHALLEERAAKEIVD